MLQRRAFIGLFGGAVVWPLAARAQQAAIPVVGFLSGGGPVASARSAAAFRAGLSAAGYVDGRNVTIEYHYLEGQYHRVPELVADLIRRRVTVIASPGFPPGALAAKAATATIPIVFAVGDDPVKLGLVASLARPGGNVTGINFFVQEIVSKRLALLHELVPTAGRIAVLVNPGNAAGAATTLKEAWESASAMGLQVIVVNASTIGEIDEAFAELGRDRAEALMLGADGFLYSRRGQIATLAARNRMPMASASRDFVEAGGLMSYGTNLTDMFRQAGIYAGNIIKGAKPADLPVMQSTKFEFAINLQTAKALGLEIPPTLLARADEVIE
jgi:putative ABC transport system substrate-binding protein